MSITPSPLPLILPGIQTFPPEMILEILERLDPAEAVRVATTCRQWHRAAKGNSAFWLSVRINETDIEDSDVVQRVLYRSRGRPISLHLEFPSHDTAGDPMDYDKHKLLCLLGDVVRGHLHRCTLLEVYAPQTAWVWICQAFAEETFPLVRSVFLLNGDASPDWQSEDSLPMPLSNISFPLLNARQLVDAELVGVSLGHAPFPSLRFLIIGHHFPDLVVDGRLNPWLFASATSLSFECMYVPAMSDTVGTPAPQPDSTLQTLALRNLQATPSDTFDADGSDEYDCGPFFAALPTSRLRYLHIDSWDLSGRIWDDFVTCLPITNAKFPLVEGLVITRMDFQWIPYATVGFFFAAFPALKRLSLSDCIWEEVIDTLEMWPMLCPRLRYVRLDKIGVILRDDQLPFRNYMLTHDLPVGDEDFQDDDYYHDLWYL
ncbi:hypothetical protein B0H11DRAFT_2239054 [Mycena galericulata]|nr:hypothetical protein B0H11DRAFT_2239054 [Mycena galericulata]